jgi:phenylpyruvate tautomerase PptA (4-oxalocrotonate tautomerase family)
MISDPFSESVEWDWPQADLLVNEKESTMPLVRIDLREGKPASYLHAIGDAVQRAMMEHLNVPERDHFQIINEHKQEHLIYDPNYLNIERTDDVVVIQVFLSGGRTTEQKRAFYARVAELVQESPGMRPQDVLINLVEDTREDWSFGNGEAQYLVLPKEEWK